MMTFNYVVGITNEHEGVVPDVACRRLRQHRHSDCRQHQGPRKCTAEGRGDTNQCQRLVTYACQSPSRGVPETVSGKTKAGHRLCPEIATRHLNLNYAGRLAFGELQGRDRAPDGCSDLKGLSRGVLPASRRGPTSAPFLEKCVLHQFMSIPLQTSHGQT